MIIKALAVTGIMAKGIFVTGFLIRGATNPNLEIKGNVNDSTSTKIEKDMLNIFLKGLATMGAIMWTGITFDSVIKVIKS